MTSEEQHTASLLIRLVPSMHKALVKRAKQERRTMAEVVRFALSEYLAKDKAR